MDTAEESLLQFGMTTSPSPSTYPYTTKTIVVRNDGDGGDGRDSGGDGGDDGAPGPWLRYATVEELSMELDRLQSYYRDHRHPTTKKHVPSDVVAKAAQSTEGRRG